jgi:ABC-type transport system substrate-binding protein
MSLTTRLRRPGTFAALVVAVVVVLAAGAAALARGLDGSSTTSAHPPVLRWSNEGISDLYTLDPARGPDFNARQAVQLIFGGLVRFGPRFQILPDAAQRWSVSRNGLVYTFTLRSNVRFGDGTRLDAADVAYSLNRTLSPQFANSSGAYLLSNILGASAVMAGQAHSARGIRVLNPRTIRITLGYPDGSFLAKLANPDGAIVPAWRVRSNPAHWDEHALGTGPFMVSRWVHGQALLLVPNPYYYAGPLRLGGIDMPFFPEPLAAYKSYRAGNLDTMGAVHFPVEELFDARGRSDFHASPRLETVFLTLNERTAPFNDARVRLAFAHALDKNALVRAVWGSFAHPTDGMMPPGLPGYNPNLRGARYNPALARRLLAEAGYPGGRGLPTIVYPVDQDAQSVVLANALARQWQRTLGVRVQTVQYTHSRYLSLLQNLQYHIAVIDWTDDYPDPENFISQQFHTGSPNNNAGWSNRTFDRLTDRADRLPPGDTARFALYRRAEQLAMSQAVTIPLANPSAGILLRRDVQGISIDGGYLLVADWTKVEVSSGTRQ